MPLHPVFPPEWLIVHNPVDFRSHDVFTDRRVRRHFFLVNELHDAENVMSELFRILIMIHCMPGKIITVPAPAIHFVPELDSRTARV